MIETLAGLALDAGTDILKAYEVESEGTTGRPSFSMIEAMGGAPLSSGIRVTPDGAMGVSAVNACVRVRAESIASAPLVTFRRNGRSKERVPDEPLYELLHDRPNPWQTSYEWREDMQRQFDLRGNAYSLIERNGRGVITNLYPLRSDRVTIQKGKDLQPYYQCSELSGVPTLPRENIFHLRGMSKDGYIGLSPIQELMEAVGLAVAAERYGAGLFQSGALHQGILFYNGSITAEEYPKLRKSIDEKLGTRRSRNGGPPMLDGDWKYQPTSMKADEAQFLQTRGNQVEEVARAYRMPLPMIGHGDKAPTYASAEQFFLAFVVHCFTPLVTRWEQAFRRDLLTEDEGDLAPLFLVDGLLRGDIKTRYAAYAIARQWGWFCVDDILELEDRNPLPDGKGQIYLQPMNMVEAGTVADGNSAGDPILNALNILAEFMKGQGPQLDTGGPANA